MPKKAIAAFSGVDAGCPARLTQPESGRTTNKNQRGTDNDWPAEGPKNGPLRNGGPEAHQQYHHHQSLDLLGKGVEALMIVVPALDRPKSNRRNKDRKKAVAVCQLGRAIG